MEIKAEYWLVGMTPAQLKETAVSAGLKPFAGKQLADWIYDKREQRIGEMTNLPLRGREALEAAGYTARYLPPCDVQVSADGTKKYLFPTLEGAFVEAVYIPDGERATLCVSSQAGCRMGCRFCMTARQGFQHNLTAGEIVNQILAIPESRKLTNMVFMGMGEPMDNLDNLLQAIGVLTADWGLGWSPSRITVSTIGVVPAMERLLRETRVSLAVSLHDPFDAGRRELMPVQRAYPAADIVASLRQFDFSHHRRLSFEYILFEGVNDSQRHVDELVHLLSGLGCRINLIRFHAIPGSSLRGASAERLHWFNGQLNRAGITTTTRRSRGEDILAACGMLSTLKKQ